MMLRKKICLLMIFLLANIAAFVLGATILANYSKIKEMQDLEDELVRNLSIFSECRIRQCNDEFQKIFVERNNSILERYSSLMKEIKSPWYIKPRQIVWPLVFLLNKDSYSVASETSLRKYYGKMGCGLDGVLCK